MAFTFEKATTELAEKLPDDRGARWLVGRFAWVTGGENGLTRDFLAGDPEAARIHRLLFEQYAHLRDCPIFPGQEPYSDESRHAALDLAETFAQVTELPLETIQANWAAIVDNIYPGEQESIYRPQVRAFTE